MSERDVIARTPTPPPTVASLRADLERLGVTPRMVLMVHSSLSSLGWVVGGAPAVVLALEEVVGPGGTIVMPSHSYGVSDPAGWDDPGVPEAWWPTIRDQMPLFDPDLTPTIGMGRIAECFRTQTGTLRSAHPTISVAARGPAAGILTAPEPLETCHGAGSPLERLYDLHAHVLLLGVGHGSNTSLHLAERRARYEPKAMIRRTLLTRRDGERAWITFDDVNGQSGDFPEIGAAFEAETGLVRRGRVGAAEALLFPQRDIVDFAIGWMERHRGER